MLLIQLPDLSLGNHHHITQKTYLGVPLTIHNPKVLNKGEWFPLPLSWLPELLAVVGIICGTPWDVIIMGPKCNSYPHVLFLYLTSIETIICCFESFAEEGAKHGCYLAPTLSKNLSLTDSSCNPHHHGEQEPEPSSNCEGPTCALCLASSFLYQWSFRL